MLINQYFSKFEELSENHKEIVSFAKAIYSSKNKDPFGRLNLDELLSGLKTNMKVPIMVCVGYETNIEDPMGDNRKSLKSGTFLILKKAMNLNNFDDVMKLIQECEQICNELLGFLDEEWQQHFENGTTDGKIFLRFDQINGAGVSPIKDNLCGWRIDFTFQEESEEVLKYNPDKFNTPIELSF